MKKVLITGAGGFIGSHLARYCSARGAAVRGLVRTEGRAAGLRDGGCELVHGDITIRESLVPAMAGCDVVFHCAWGGETLADARYVNVEGTRNVLDAALQAGVRRVVYVSTVAAHDTRAREVVTEDMPLQFRGSPYAVTKAEADQIALGVGRQGRLEVVVIRPTLVYGPGSPNWVLRYFWRVKYSQIALIGGGHGLANLVYVDDLVAGMWLAATTPGITGEAFLVSGTPTPWREYLDHFARMCSRPLPPSVPVWRARVEARWSKWHHRFTRRERRIDEHDLELMTQTCRVSTEKARRVLGFVPAWSLAQGMDHVECWLRNQGYLPPQVADARLSTFRRD